MARSQALLPEFADLPDDSLVRAGQIVGRVVPVSYATWWRMVKDGRAPPPTRPSPGVTAWHVGGLRAWMRPKV